MMFLFWFIHYFLVGQSYDFFSTQFFYIV